MITESNTTQLTTLDTLNGIKITWQGKQDWVKFFSSALSILYYLAIFGMIIYFYLSANFGGIPVLAVVITIAFLIYAIYYLFTRVMRLIEALLDHEVIQVEDKGVTIEKSGFLNIERQFVYPVEKIACIRMIAYGVTRSLGLTFASRGTIMTRLKLEGDCIFCRGISEADAVAMLGKIHERFPQYRVAKP
jgi:hypothetical protein